tara:strand:+ start:559 stop:1683 length:1125 start_codon:yes stop_codon:yes gene_type:complete
MADDIDDLLKSVYSIREKFDFLDSETKQKFNIFSVLDIMKKEVTTHSRFLAHLLDPKGSHQFGNSFIKLLFEILKNKLEDEFYDNFHFDDYSVAVELNTITSGRIDIIIEDAKSLVIIENKIEAEDQYRQLEHYYSYGKSKNKEFKLFYLSLNENNVPSKNSLGELKDEDFICISYNTEIYSWMELCIKESANHHGLREVINQYLKTIQYLTGKGNNNMNEEILNTIKSSEINLKAAIKINAVFMELINRLIKDFENKFKKTNKGVEESFLNGKRRLSVDLIENKNLKLFIKFRKDSQFEKLAWWVDIDESDIENKNRIPLYYETKEINDKVIIIKDYNYNKEDLIIGIQSGSILKELNSDIEKLKEDLKNILK